MYIPPALVQIEHERKLKDWGVDQPDQASKMIADWQKLSRVSDYHNNNRKYKTTRHFFSWTRLMYLYRRYKAMIRLYFERDCIEESCDLSISTPSQNPVDCTYK